MSSSPSYKTSTTRLPPPTNKPEQKRQSISPSSLLLLLFHLLRRLQLLNPNMSAKIYPSEVPAREEVAPASEKVVEWTVWKKSSMSFVGCDGFSVYDGEGRLAFRVDNYSRRSKFLVGEILLMDAVGKPLISLKPQVLSVSGEWKGYRGESKGRSESSLFTMRRPSFSRKKDVAVDVFMHGGGGGGGGAGAGAADFRIEGCFRKRCCKIRGRGGEVLGQISPKRAGPSVVLGDDVFSLAVKEGAAGAELMMAFIIVMDRIC